MTLADFIDIRPGARLHVVPPQEPLGEAYEATVLRVSDSSIKLSAARRDKDMLATEPGETLTLLIALRGRPYRFRSRVRSVEDEEADGFTIEHPDAAEKAERRSFYRIATRIDPSFAGRYDDDEGIIVLREATIIDVSGGGVRLRLPDALGVEDRVHLVFSLEDDPGEIEIDAEVLRVVPPDPGRRFYHAHCHFIEPPRSMTERIVRYVFRQQIVQNQQQRAS